MADKSIGAGPIRLFADRWQTVQRIWFRPWVAVIAAAYGLLTVAQLWAANFGSAHVQSVMRLGNHIPHWSPWAWAFLGLLLVLVIGFEGAVREFRRLDVLVGISGPPNPPDFTAEFAEEDRLYREYQRDSDHDEEIERWIVGVYEKLSVWSPAAARHFKPPELQHTPESVQRARSSPMAAAAQMAAQMNPQPEPEPALRRLKLHAERLAEIVSPSSGIRASPASIPVLEPPNGNRQRE